ncbi:MAG: hypothetical protein P1U34_09100 [Coxiellaceae bacterium]|nr:hypothetical protein [Coxiellaceae bacterium]
MSRSPDPMQQSLLQADHLATPPAVFVTEQGEDAAAREGQSQQSPRLASEYQRLSDEHQRCLRLQSKYNALLEKLNDRFLKQHAAAVDAANPDSKFALKLHEIDNIGDYASILSNVKLSANPKALLKKLVKEITSDLGNAQREMKRLEKPFRAAELIHERARAEALIAVQETDLEALNTFMRSRAGQRALVNTPGLLARIEGLPAVAEVIENGRRRQHQESIEQEKRDYPQRLFEEQGVTLVDQWNQAKIFSMLTATVAVLGGYIAAFAIKRDDPEDTNTTILASVLAVVSIAGFCWGAKNQFSSASRNAEAILNWPDLVLGKQSGYISTKILPDSNNAKPVRQHSQPLSSDVSVSASAFVRMQNNARMFGLLALAMAGLSAYIAITVKRDDPEDINATVLASLLGLISCVGFSWGARHQNKEAEENAEMVLDRPGGIAEFLPAAGDDAEAGMLRAASKRAYITQENFTWIEGAATKSRKVTTGVKSGLLGGVIMMSICAGSDWLTKGETRVGPVAQGIMVGAFLFTAIAVPWSLQRWQRLPDPFGASVCKSFTPDAHAAVARGECKEDHKELMYRGQSVSAAEQRGIDAGLFERAPSGDDAKAVLTMTAKGEGELAALRAQIAAAKAAKQAADEQQAAGVPAASPPSM